MERRLCERLKSGRNAINKTLIAQPVFHGLAIRRGRARQGRSQSQSSTWLATYAIASVTLTEIGDLRYAEELVKRTSSENTIISSPTIFDVPRFKL